MGVWGLDIYDDEAIRKLESYHCIPEDNVDAKHERFGEYIKIQHNRARIK